MPKKRYLANPDVSCRQEPDSALLFNPDADPIVAVNSVGHLIWQALARPLTQEEIVAHVMKTCEDVPLEQVAADVEAFLQSLQSGGFVGEVLNEDGRLHNAPTARQHSPVKSTLSDTPPGQECLHFYRGSSMLGTFRSGDYLTVEPGSIAAIRPGDVVIYRGRDQAGEPEDVVHRVVAVTPGGLVTQGDNNPQIDNVLVTQDMLVGRVTHVERAGRTRPVQGGEWGLLGVRVRHAWRRVLRLGWRLLRIVGRRPYRWLRESGWARRLWRPEMMRVLMITEDGPLVKYVSGRRTVARWWPETGRFQCRRPYDLVISRLPPSISPNSGGE